MSVPAIITLTCVSVVERVESYILNLVQRFHTARNFTSIILLNDNKAVLPAFYHRVKAFQPVRINTI